MKAKPTGKASLKFIAWLALVMSVPAGAAAPRTYAANNGVDSGSCGSSEFPCRTITQAIANAVPGTDVIVGPGRYGDLDNNGTLGGPGEETSPATCLCVLAITKAITLRSSAGAAATVIDARVFGYAPPDGHARNVAILADDVNFGLAGAGFTVTNSLIATAPGDESDGLTIFSTRVNVRGNRFIHTETTQLASQGFAIGPMSDQDLGEALIEGNFVSGWYGGIYAVPNYTVRQNVVQTNHYGIAGPGVVTGNTAIGNRVGIQLAPNGNAVTGNAVYGNHIGVEASSRGGAMSGNNIFGNGCGLSVFFSEAADGTIVATNNYWGAASGPAIGPPGDICGTNAFQAVVTPFATKPFSVKILNP